MRMEPLMETLRKSDAEEMHLEPGERVYVVKQGQRSLVGREPVSAGALLQMAPQALKPFEVAVVDQKPQTIVRAHGNAGATIDSDLISWGKRLSRHFPFDLRPAPPPSFPNTMVTRLVARQTACPSHYVVRSRSTDMRAIVGFFPSCPHTSERSTE